MGVIHVSGHHHVVVDGLRQGLRDLGLEEGKQFVLDIRQIKDDPRAAEEAARALERATAASIPSRWGWWRVSRSRAGD